MEKNIFYSLVLLILSFGLFSCVDKFDDPQDTIDADEERIQRYISQNNLNASRTNSGLYHIITADSSSNGLPQVNNVLEVSYKASLLETGEVFGEQDGYTFQPSVGSFMAGLSEGVLLMGQGGKSTFLVPSHLAFGIGSGTLGGVLIPANSIVILEVELKAIRSLAEQEQEEDRIIEEYMTANDLVATSDSLGVYRIVLEQGDSTRFGNSEALNVAYSVSMLDGVVFDSSDDFSFILNTSNLISGWHIGVGMMRKKEKALIIIPSHRAYGASGSGSSGSIAPFAPIIFTMEIL